MDNLTVVVPYRDNRRAIEGLLDTLPEGLPLVVVDDCSTVGPPVTALEARPSTRLIRLEERGYFSGAVNAGIVACETDVLVLNQDVRLQGDWWAELEGLRGEFACIGDGVMDHPAHPNGYVQGTCMFLRRDAIEAVGPFDAVHWPLWGATAEWQLRACRRGFRAMPIEGCDWFTHSRRGAYGSSIRRLLEQEPEKRGLYIRTPPLISVVTSCYNYGRYLPDLVASLVGGETSLGTHPGQTFQGFELVICDDASTDGSWETAQGLADGWKGIRVYRRSANSGTAAALNAAISHAHGRYVMVMDADDMLEPECLERYLGVLEQNPHRLVYSDQRLFADGRRGEVWRMRDYDFEELLQHNHVPSGVMFPRSAWREVGGYPPAFARGRQDWAWAVRMGAHGYCGVRVPEALYLYRRERQNRTLRNSDPQWRRTFLGMMRETFPELYRGERPMGCCGRRSAATSKGAPAQTITLGAEGMTLLEYVGTDTGRSTWWGPVTHARYVVSARRPVIYVDNRDVEGMVGMVADRQPVFRPYVAPEPIAPETEEIAPEPTETEPEPEES